MLILKNGKINRITRCGKEGFEHHHRPEGSVMTVDFDVNGQNFMALNGGPEFKFSDGGEEGPCGWLKDKYGLSWQVNPTVLAEMLASPAIRI